MDIKDNVFSDNGQGAIVGVKPNHVQKLSANSGTGNGQNSIQVRGGDITTSGRWVKQGFAYVITGDVTVRHSSYSSGSPVATLTIEPGVEIRFEPGAGLYIGKDYPNYSYYAYWGALSVQGTAEDPVVFTSNAISPAPGDWKGIYFRDWSNNSQNRLQHCVIEYGGHTHNANLYLDKANAAITGSIIRRSSGHGVHFYSSTSTLTGNDITGNGKDGIYLTPSSTT